MNLTSCQWLNLACAVVLIIGIPLCYGRPQQIEEPTDTLQPVSTNAVYPTSLSKPKSSIPGSPPCPCNNCTYDCWNNTSAVQYPYVINSKYLSFPILEATPSSRNSFQNIPSEQITFLHVGPKPVSPYPLSTIQLNTYPLPKLIMNPIIQSHIHQSFYPLPRIHLNPYLSIKTNLHPFLGQYFYYPVPNHSLTEHSSTQNIVKEGSSDENPETVPESNLIEGLTVDQIVAQRTAQEPSFRATKKRTQILTLKEAHKVALKSIREAALETTKMATPEVELERALEVALETALNRAVDTALEVAPRSASKVALKYVLEAALHDALTTAWWAFLETAKEASMTDAGLLPSLKASHKAALESNREAARNMSQESALNVNFEVALDTALKVTVEAALKKAPVEALKAQLDSALEETLREALTTAWWTFLKAAKEDPMMKTAMVEVGLTRSQKAALRTAHRAALVSIWEAAGKMSQESALNGNFKAALDTVLEAVLKKAPGAASKTPLDSALEEALRESLTTAWWTFIEAAKEAPMMEIAVVEAGLTPYQKAALLAAHKAALDTAMGTALDTAVKAALKESPGVASETVLKFSLEATLGNLLDEAWWTFIVAAWREKPMVDEEYHYLGNDLQAEKDV